MVSRSVTAPALAALTWAAVQSVGSCTGTSIDAVTAHAERTVLSTGGAELVALWKGCKKQGSLVKINQQANRVSLHALTPQVSRPSPTGVRGPNRRPRYVCYEHVGIVTNHTATSSWSQVAPVFVLLWS